MEVCSWPPLVQNSKKKKNGPFVKSNCPFYMNATLKRIFMEFSFDISSAQYVLYMEI